MIEVENLTKHYGNHVAIADVTFRAEKGEILGFLGPNGAGKTTTMRILTGYLPQTRGTARVAGFDVLEQSLEVRRRIGYLPENVPLYQDLPVVDYLEFVAKLKRIPRRQRRGQVERVMENCGIAQVKYRTVGKLSKGFRQRVGLAQALVSDPEVLILDEPTVGLDPKQIVEIRELIRNLAGERTIVLSTHILPEVSLLCQRVIIINKGRLVTVDTPTNLKAMLRNALVIDVVVRGDGQAIVRRLESLANVKSVAHVGEKDDIHTLRVESSNNTDIRESVSRELVGAGFGLLGLATSDMSLEDVFVELVTKEETD